VSGPLRVLVSGASGFIGRHLLAAAQGQFNIQSVERDAALGPADALVHLAGLAHRPLAAQIAQYDEYIRVNTTLPLRRAEEAAAAGVKHFIFISTIGVHGRSTAPNEAFNEDSAIRPDGPYAETKAKAEEALGALAARTGLALTIIRPVLVYGAGARGNFPTLLRAIRMGLPLPLKSVQNRRAFVAVDNLVSLILHRVSARPEGRAVFIAADEERLSTPDFIGRIGAVLGQTPVLLPFAPAVLNAALRAAGRAHMADSLLGSLDVDTGAAHRAGWRPVVTMDEALARAVK